MFIRRLSTSSTLASVSSTKQMDNGSAVAMEGGVVAPETKKPEPLPSSSKHNANGSSVISNIREVMVLETEFDPLVSGFGSDEWADTLPDSEHVRFFKLVD